MIVASMLAVLCLLGVCLIVIDRLRVAQALLSVQRLVQRSRVDFGLAGVSFEGSSAVLRVESLLADPALASSRKAGRWLIAVAMMLVVLAEPLHHQTEGLLGLFAR